MNKHKHSQIIIPRKVNTTSRSTGWRRFTFVTFTLAISFGIAPLVQATCVEGCGSNENTYLGDSVLSQVTSGFNNTAVGYAALAADTTGSWNTAMGLASLENTTTGQENTADGVSSLQSNTTGSFNTAVGYAALYGNTTASNNTACGFFALEHNTTGSGNTGLGQNALVANTTGNENTATGAGALNAVTTGSSNTAIGVNALLKTTTASFDNALGDGALFSNTTGTGNTGLGDFALFNNTTGSGNIGIGGSGGANLTTGSNNIDIGNGGVAGESNTIRVGTQGSQTATYVAGIRGVAVGGAQPVAVSANGQLGVRASSARFKEAIKPMDKASEAILSLKPVTFRYKKQLDPSGIPQFGLVAEEVAKTAPDLVITDTHGKPFTVRYEEVNAMLLNEFLKEHRRVAELTSKLESAQKEDEEKFARQQEQIESLTTSLRSVSQRVDVTRPMVASEN